MTIQGLSLNQNIRVVEKAWVEALSKKSRDQFVEQHSENVVMYDPTLPNALKGLAALGAWLEGLHGVFPDYQVRKVRSFGQDEWICLEAEESGTMRGPLHGPGGRTIPPTNKSFKIPSTIVCRVVNGKINEVRVYYVVLGLMAQLGLGP